MPKSFTLISDPGHGWLAVTKADLSDLGLTPKSFSSYSYRNRENTVFYLEEDCDAAIFWEAYKAKYGAAPVLNEVYQEKTPIRGFPRI